MDIISLINIINANECLNNRSFKRNWPQYVQRISSFLGNNPSEERIVNLGKELSFVFNKDDTSRDQSDVSVSGNSWSRLVNWYLNICFIGTRCWAVNNFNMLPDQVKRAITIKIEGKKVPNSKEIIVLAYNGNNIPTISLPGDTSNIDLKATYKETYKEFYKNLDLHDLKIILLSSKTNCSDLIAIPLFWNFCYKGNQLLDIFNIQVGNEKENPECFLDKKVYYSIVTVPTGQEKEIISGNIPGQSSINKLGLLDGGFYWCRHSSNKVRSFDNFFSDNLGFLSQKFGQTLSENYSYTKSTGSIFYKLFNS